MKQLVKSKKEKDVLYSISVEKSELEKFIGTDFASIVDGWSDKFSDPYVYNDIGREKFFKRFGRKE